MGARSSKKRHVRPGLSRTLPLLALLFGVVAGCGNQRREARSVADGKPASAQAASSGLEAVDTTDLTLREKRQWTALTEEVLAPCEDMPVSVAQCLNEGRDCQRCLPAAEFLVRQLVQGKGRAQAAESYRARFSSTTVQEVHVGSSPVSGAEGGSVVIVEWADFQCPACRDAVRSLHGLVKKYPEDVRLVFKHYPLRQHSHAEGAALASVAAQRQGKFWQMHELLFSSRAPLDRAALVAMAQELGLDPVRFARDLDSPEVRDVVVQDKTEAHELGLSGTPMIYINGRRYDPSVDGLEAWVDLEVALRAVESTKGASR